MDISSLFSDKNIDMMNDRNGSTHMLFSNRDEVHLTSHHLLSDLIDMAFVFDDEFGNSCRAFAC